MSLLPQFGFLELLLVAALALVVVGPRDLPKLMRAAGRSFAQMRRMASEFTAAFDQMAREAELDEMRKEIETLKANNPVNDVKRAVSDVVKPIKDAVDEEKTALRQATAGQGDADPAPTSQMDVRSGEGSEKVEDEASAGSSSRQGKA
ncbi:MAG: twin-arginine translocase subunit TatB [Parvularculaceae bacterium]|nr:MAG: twin-arginine translocase subunit TatB [Parvularculaceae bacterium]